MRTPKTGPYIILEPVYHDHYDNFYWSLTAWIGGQLITWNHWSLDRILRTISHFNVTPRIQLTSEFMAHNTKNPTLLEVYENNKQKRKENELQKTST